MKKLKVELIVELDSSDVGFMVIPTSNEKVLKNGYAVSKKKTSGGLQPSWTCSNGVHLKGPEIEQKE